MVRINETLIALGCNLELQRCTVGKEILIAIFSASAVDNGFKLQSQTAKEFQIKDGRLRIQKNITREDKSNGTHIYVFIYSFTPLYS